jgi:DNA excision repair protein ERCC-2
VRAFVAPLALTGSLDARLAAVADEDPRSLGAQMHTRIQQRQLRAEPDAQSELPVQAELGCPGFTCRVRGRIDLLLPGAAGPLPDGEGPMVEEIKTGFRPAAILRALAEAPEHPYALQARMYAWMRQRDTGQAHRCRIRIVSLLDLAETLVELPPDPGFPDWVAARVRAQYEAFLRARARTLERRRLGAALAFPFAPPRPGQQELVDRVGQALRDGRRLLLQAPTGLGKTAAILFPALARALDQDLQVFYATPRNSQHRVAEDCVQRIRTQGHPVRSVTLRAKERVCPQPLVDCRPEVCPRALGYYDRLHASGALDTLAERGCATAEVIGQLADQHGLCPFELALDAAPAADVVIGDYNYALSPQATLGRLFGSPEEAARRILLVDEAHNLPARATDWFSPALDLAMLEDLRQRRQLPPNPTLRRRASAQFRRCAQLLESLAGAHRVLEPDPRPFFGEEFRIGKLLAWAAGAGHEVPPGHPLQELFHAWSGFCTGLRELGPAHTVSWIPPGRLQITCADAAGHLAERMAALSGAVLFSATLKPFLYHQRLTGLDTADTAEVPSPFPAAHRKVLVVPQISTLYRTREREVPRIAHFLERVLPLRTGHYFVFFPSFEMLEQTLPLLRLPDFRILAQPRRAAPAQIQAILDSLREAKGLRELRDPPGIVVLAVQGGSLAEGIDCPGEALIGCVVVGPPLPPFDLERDRVRRYFDRRYGCGEAYAYTYPAMARAVQAAGRVLRTPQDRGLLVFLDRRFLAPEFAACLPQDWFQDSPRELVSAAILADVRRFWAEDGTELAGR